MSKITPFLWFEKDGRDAAKFYLSVFGEHAKIEDDSVLEGTPSGSVDIINLEIFGQEFTFMTAGPFRTFNEAISFVVSCDDQKEVDYYWEKLSAVPEAEQCGWCKDKYGVSWQIVPKMLSSAIGNPDPEKAKRAVAAMLKMKKLIIADLEQA